MGTGVSRNRRALRLSNRRLTLYVPYHQTNRWNRIQACVRENQSYIEETWHNDRFENVPSPLMSPDIHWQASPET